MAECKNWSFVCCGQRYDSVNKTYLKQMQKRHEKTVKHKINQAVADAWIRYGEFYAKREKALIEAYEGQRLLH